MTTITPAINRIRRAATPTGVGEGRLRALAAATLVAGLLGVLCLTPNRCLAQAAPQQTYQQVVPYSSLADGSLVIDVIFNNKQSARMVVDTGSPVTGITDKLADKVGLENSLGGPSLNGKDLPVVKIARMDIGQFHADNSQYVILNAKTLASVTGNNPVDGIIGANFLTLFPAMFDFQKHQITFYSQSLSADDIKAIGMGDASVVALDNPGNGFIYACPVKITNGAKDATTQLQIDTGSPLTILSNNLAKQLTLAPFGATFQAQTYNSLKYDMSQAFISGLALGGFPDGALSIYFETKAMPKDTSFPVGLDVLSHYRILLDFGKKVMYVKPADTIAQ